LDPNLQVFHRGEVWREQTSSRDGGLKSSFYEPWRRCPMMLLTIGLIVGANLGVLLLSLCRAAADGPATALRHTPNAQNPPRTLWDHAA
jgi:hypothetical protein